MKLPRNFSTSFQYSFEHNGFEIEVDAEDVAYDEANSLGEFTIDVYKDGELVDENIDNWVLNKKYGVCVSDDVSTDAMCKAGFWEHLEMCIYYRQNEEWL